MCSRLCAKFHADTMVQNQLFQSLAKMYISAESTDIVGLNLFAS